MAQDHSDHDASKEPVNPLWSQIHRFLWCSIEKKSVEKKISRTWSSKWSRITDPDPKRDAENLPKNGNKSVFCTYFIDCTAKETRQRKKTWGREAREKLSRAASCFARGFLSRLARRSKRKRDYLQSNCTLKDALTVKNSGTCHKHVKWDQNPWFVPPQVTARWCFSHFSSC